MLKKVSSFLKYDKYDIAFKGNKYHLKLDLVGQKELMDVIERKSSVSIERIKPTMIAFPTLSSYNQDHRQAAYATHAAVRPSHGEKHFVQTVLTSEMPADNWRLHHQQQPNFFIPLTKQDLVTKVRAFKLYKSQVRPLPNPRAIEAIHALAVLRGTQSGNKFAEGFVSLRTVLNP